MNVISIIGQMRALVETALYTDIRLKARQWDNAFATQLQQASYHFAVGTMTSIHHKLTEVRAPSLEAWTPIY